MNSSAARDVVGIDAVDQLSFGLPEGPR